MGIKLFRVVLLVLFTVHFRKIPNIERNLTAIVLSQTAEGKGSHISSMRDQVGKTAGREEHMIIIIIINSYLP